MKNSIQLFGVGAVLAAVVMLFSPAQAAQPADFGLKEGDMISASGTQDPDIYIINVYGYKRLFLNPVIFSFYGHLGGFANVKPVTSGTREAFVTTTLFRNCETNDPKVYAVEVTGEDTAILHHVDISGETAVQQDPEFFKKIFCVNSREANWYSQSAMAYTAVSQIPSYHRGGVNPTPNPTQSPTPVPTPTPAPVVTWMNKQLTSVKGASVWPALAYNGTDYGMVWVDDRDGVSVVYFARVDKAGVKLTNDVQLGATTDAGSSTSSPDIIWDGSQFVIMYPTSTSIVLVRVNSDGSRVATDVPLDSGCYGKISYNGLAYGVVQQTPCASDGNLYFSYIDPDGTRLVNKQIIAVGGDSHTRIFSHGTTSFGVMYNSMGTAHYSRMEINANRLIDNIQVADAVLLAGAWNDSQYGILISPNHFASFDMNGVAVQAKTSLSFTGLSAPDMIWNGTSYTIADGQNYYRLSSAGILEQQAMITSHAPVGGSRVSWAGDRAGVVWHDGSVDPYQESGSEHYELYFASDK